MSDIGQSSQPVQDIESALISDGTAVIKAFIISKFSFLGIWFLSPITGFFAGVAAEFVITQLDRTAFSIYVAAKTGKKVGDYMSAVDSGNKDEIDKAGDALIHMGGT